MRENGGRFVFVERITGKVVSKDICSDSSLESALYFESAEEAETWLNANRELNHIQKKNLILFHQVPRQ